MKDKNRLQYTKRSHIATDVPTTMAGIGIQSVRQANWTTSILWLITLAWVVRVTVLVRPRDAEDFASIDPMAVAQIVVVLIAIVSVVVNRRTVLLWVRTRGTSTRLLLWYYALCLVSATWASLPEYSAYRAIEFMTMFLVVQLAITYCQDFRHAERVVLFATAVVVGLTLVAKVRLQGFSFSLAHWHTNSYSASALMMFCYCIGEYFNAEPTRRPTLARFGAIGLAFVILGTSAATNLAAVAGVLLAASLIRARALLLIGLGLLACVLFALVQLDLTESDRLLSVLFPGKTPNQVITMHGRTFMWARLFDYFKQDPMLGHGFAALTSPGGQMFAADPHSSFFSVIVGTGIAGLALAVGYFIKLVREMRTTIRMRLAGAVGCTTAIAAALINSLSMPLVLSEWEESSVVFACFSALFLIFVVSPSRESIRHGLLPTKMRRE